MPEYFYIAKSLEGKKKTGTLEAENEKELAQKLRAEGFILVRAIPKEKPKKRFEFSLPFFRSIPLTEKMMFTRNLQVMVGSGLSLPRCLEVLANQTKNPYFKDALLEIKEEIRKGKTFSAAVSEHPDIFPELFQSMIEVGEESGTLEEVLKNLSLQMEREHDLRSKIKGAMIYPAVIISAMFAIGILMLILVVPQIAKTFEELQIELPPTTQFVIALGTFLAEKWYLFILGLVFFLFFFFQFIKTEKGKIIFDKVLLKIPVISPIVKKSNSALTCRTLSSLISAGVPIVKSLEITSKTLGNIFFQKALEKVAKEVRKGEKLSDSLRGYETLYAPLVIEMIEVGEETGETSKVLSKLADFFEGEVSLTTQNLASVIEPILMIIIGGMVGFFAISMIQPMYSMLGSL